VELYAGRPAIVGRPPKFVYFGGGTPSYVSVRHLQRLVERLQQAIPWEGVEEVTFECEPGTLSRSKIAAVREVGVTRLSLGIENFDDEILRENGRAHLSGEIFRCLPWIEEASFEQLNVDLIAGMLGETWTTWRETVAKTVDLAPDSVTVYQMELPYNTRFSQRVLDGDLKKPLADWAAKRAWHDYAFEELDKAGYELSSAYTMVKDATTCRFVYRDSVWRGCDLLGTGVASFSHLRGVHFQNVDGWGEYLGTLDQGRLPMRRARRTSPEERLTRELILQLKLGEVRNDYFRQKFGTDIVQEFAGPLERMEAEGMLRSDAEGVRLSRKGLLRVDSLLPEFYEDRYRDARYT
jgi:oxygen-independent coproporphyrinogen-3 oxidase